MPCVLIRSMQRRFYTGELGSSMCQPQKSAALAPGSVPVSMAHALLSFWLLLPAALRSCAALRATCGNACAVLVPLWLHLSGAFHRFICTSCRTRDRTQNYLQFYPHFF